MPLMIHYKTNKYKIARNKKLSTKTDFAEASEGVHATKACAIFCRIVGYTISSLEPKIKIYILF